MRDLVLTLPFIFMVPTQALAPTPSTARQGQHLLSDLVATAKAQQGTEEGRAYERALGNSLWERFLAAVRGCRNPRQTPLTFKFDLVLVLDASGSVSQERHSRSPQPELVACIGTALSKQRWPRPPYSGWVLWLHVSTSPA